MQIIKLSTMTITLLLATYVEAGDILSGQSNTSTSILSVVVGGENNHNNVDSTGNSDYSTIGGGKANNANHSGYSVISGGSNNGLSSALYGVVSGGYNNVGIKSFVTISGGKEHRAEGAYSTIAGGSKNKTTGTVSTISGGFRNLTSGEASTVGGGQDNNSTGKYSFSVGNKNLASGDWSVAMGYQNQATNLESVALGRENISSGTHSFSHGIRNKALGHNSVAWGFYSEAHGFTSFAFGKRVRANKDGTVIFGDTNGGETNSSLGTFPLNERSADQKDTFYGFFDNGYKLYTTASINGSGVELNHGDGAWNTLSDKTKKENYQKIDKQKVLDKLIALPMEKWNYTAQNDKIKHIGPYAQDFNKAYGLGDGKLTISTIDSDGIAFASIQALAERNKQLNQKNKLLESKLSNLESRFSKLEKKLY